MKSFIHTFSLFNISSSFVYANPQIEKAYHDKQSNVQVQRIGKVSRILSDDNNGSKHQKFY